jgi:hypothetical protein
VPLTPPTFQQPAIRTNLSTGVKATSLWPNFPEISGNFFTPLLQEEAVLTTDGQYMQVPQEIFMLSAPAIPIIFHY